MNALSIALIVVVAVLLAAVVLLVIYVVRLQKSAVTQASRTEEIVDALAAANAALTETKTAINAIQDGQVAATATDQARFDAITREFSQSEEKLESLRRDTTDKMELLRRDTSDKMDDLRRDNAEKLEGFRRDTAEQLGKNRDGIETRLDAVRDTVSQQLRDIRTDNNKQLETMRATVDEKLTQTLNDRISSSFKQVSDQLEQVYKGLGDMQTVATGVGDLKKVLSNVKTRGILGEVQLGAILSDILTPEQYETNVATKPGSTERVEFAVKLPTSDGDPILLPIDSKFPGDAYAHLQDALEATDSESVDAARKQLDRQLKKEAKDICDKYLSVPETTNFGIMFLPFEGLYAEVVNRPELIAALSRDYHVNVAGPSTMAAILNSLQMSYQTLNLQKRTDEVLRVLSAVKAELPNYQKMLQQARAQIDKAGRTVDKIITTRTNVMERKLKAIDAMEDADAAARLLSEGVVDEALDADAYETDDLEGED